MIYKKSTCTVQEYQGDERQGRLNAHKQEMTKETWYLHTKWNFGMQKDLGGKTVVILYYCLINRIIY